MHSETDRRDRTRALLEWLLEAGVDLPVDETPHDRFVPVSLTQQVQIAGHAAQTDTREAAEMRDRAIASQTSANTLAPADTRAPAVALAPAALAAAEAAAAATDLASLEDRIAAFTGCSLRKSAMHTLCGAGPHSSDLLIVAGMPTDDEDRTGTAFAGPAGGLLDKMLAAIGLKRAGVRICHLLPWRTPGERRATAAEIAVCLPFLQRQIAFVGPRAVLAFGLQAAQSLSGETQTFRQIRSRALTVADTRPAIPLIATWHPRDLLTQPLRKREAWQDLLKLRAVLDGTSNAGA